MSDAFRSHKQSCIPNAAVIAQARREPCSPFPILRGTLGSFQRMGFQCSATVEFEWTYLTYTAVKIFPIKPSGIQKSFRNNSYLFPQNVIFQNKVSQNQT